MRTWLRRASPAAASASSWAAASSRARRIRSACSLFCSWLFSFWQLTTIPVGTWVIRTAESVVLTLWPPGAAAAEDVDAQVVLVDPDVDGLGLGHHQDAGRAGVDAALRLGHRHPLHAVHAALELQQRRTARGRARERLATSPPP